MSGYLELESNEYATRCILQRVTTGQKARGEVRCESLVFEAGCRAQRYYPSDRLIPGGWWGGKAAQGSKSVANLEQGGVSILQIHAQRV